MADLKAIISPLSIQAFFSGVTGKQQVVIIDPYQKITGVISMLTVTELSPALSRCVSLLIM